MDSQIVFNFVTDYLARQKQPSVNDRFCSLRGDNGTKCAMGCLIPDSDYIPEMERDSGVYALSEQPFNKWLKEFFSPTPEQYDLLRELQICHDRAGPRAGANLFQNAKNKWSWGFDVIATDFDLEFDRVAFENKLNDPEYK